MNRSHRPLVPWVLFLLGALLFGCAPTPKQGTTTIRFPALTLGVNDGGIMIFAMEPVLQRAAAMKYVEGEVRSIENGVWDFYVVRWDGPAPFKNTVKCGSINIALNGGNRDVPITLSQAGCDLPFFSGSAFKLGQQFLDLTLVSCRGLAGIIDGTSSCDANIGITKSFRLAMPSYLQNPQGRFPNGEFLVSECVNTVSGVSKTPTNFKIPVGSGSSSPISVGIFSYEGADCVETSTTRKIFFQRGLLAGATEGSAFIRKNDASNRTVVFFDHFPTDLGPLATTKTLIKTDSSFLLDIKPFFTGGEAPISFTLAGSGTLDSASGFYIPSGENSATVTATDHRGQSVSLIISSFAPIVSYDLSAGISGTGGSLSFARSGAGTFLNSSGVLSSASTSFRIEYDQNHQSLGLMIEKGSTNMLLQSAALDTTANWPLGGPAVGVTANSTASPDNTTSAETVQDSSTSNLLFLKQTTATAIANLDYNFSVFVKKDPSSASSIIAIYFLQQGGSNCSARVFDLNNMTVSAPTNLCSELPTSDKHFGIIPYPSGWYRIFTSLKTSSPANPLDVRIYPGYANSLDPTGNSTTMGSAFFWGAQVEAAKYPTSYIPTTSVAASRGGDTLTLSTLPANFLSTQGSVMVEWVNRLNEDGEPATVLSLFKTSPVSFQSIERISGSKLLNLKFVQSSATVMTSTFPSFVGLGLNRAAYTYEAGQTVGVLNAGLPESLQIPTSLPLLLTSMRIGSDNTGANQINGHLRRVMGWDQILDDQVIFQMSHNQ